MLDPTSDLPEVQAVGDHLLTIEQLARVVAMTPEAIRQAIHRGRFPVAPVRIGARLRWSAGAVRRFIQGGEAAGK